MAVVPLPRDIVTEMIMSVANGLVGTVTLMPLGGLGKGLLLLTRDHPDGTIETVASLQFKQGSPPGSRSPWDRELWVHQISASEGFFRAVALKIFVNIYPVRIYMNVHRDNANESEMCSIAGLELCGIGRDGWRIWASQPVIAQC